MVGEGGAEAEGEGQMWGEPVKDVGVVGGVDD